MRRLLNFLIFSLFNLLILSAQASWYWPFGHDEDNTNAPPRLHRLLEKANDYIELAEDEALNGNADKAIENYKLALGELDRVEAENPDRAEKPEFAPLRNRRAVCSAAIDAIRFAQVNENERPVAVSDTTELQKRWNQKHGITNGLDGVEKELEMLEEEIKKTEEKPEAKVEQKPDVKEEKKNAAKEEKKPEVKKEVPAKVSDVKPSAAETVSTKKVESAQPLPKDWAARLQTAKKQLLARDYVAADVLLESLLKERENDLNALLLRAAAQSGMGSNYAAWRTLEKAMRTHPRSYLPYYNLANLALMMNEGVKTAREYYDMGRMVGGPVNAALEAKLKETK